MCLQEAQKHILFSLLTICITCFRSYLTLKISPLTSFLSRVVRLLFCVFIVKTSLNFYKICFMPYSTTLSMKETLRRSKVRGGVEGRYERGQRFNGFLCRFFCCTFIYFCLVHQGRECQSSLKLYFCFPFLRTKACC